MGFKTQNSSCYLMFAALSEILLDMYEKTYLLKQYDPALEIKLRNLKANFERTSKHAHSLFTEEEQLSFFSLIRIFEALIKAAQDTTDFSDLSSIINSWLKNEITMVSDENIIEIAKNLEGESL